MKSNCIAILGSSRSYGNTRKVLEIIRPELNFELLDLNQFQIGYFDYENRNQGDDFISLVEKMLHFEQFLLATPVYWYSMSAQMKTFLDRWTDLLDFRTDLGESLKGRNLSVLSCGPDDDVPEYFYRPFEDTAAYMELTFGAKVHSWLNGEKLAEACKKPIKQFIAQLS